MKSGWQFQSTVAYKQTEDDSPQLSSALTGIGTICYFLSSWINVLMCLKVAVLREVIALNPLIYRFKTSQKLKIAETLFFKIFLSTVAWEKGREWWENWLIHDLLILVLKLAPSAPPTPCKWMVKSPRTIYPSFQYVQSCLWWIL